MLGWREEMVLANGLWGSGFWMVESGFLEVENLFSVVEG